MFGNKRMCLSATRWTGVKRREEENNTGEITYCVHKVRCFSSSSSFFTKSRSAQINKKELKLASHGI